MGATVTSILPRLREHYNNATAIEIYYTSSKDVNPMLAAMDAIADTGEGYGRQLVIPICYGHPTSTGQDFTKVLAKAQGATTGSATIDDRWTVNPVTIDGVAQWSRDAMDATEGRGAKETFKVMTAQMDGCIESIRKQLATYCFGDGTGTLARILTVSTTGFTVAADLVNRFHEGMDVSTSTTATGAVKNAAGTPNLLVSGIDYLNASGTGTVYTSTDPTSTAGGRTAQAVNDYVFNYNDHPNAGLAAYANYVQPWGAAAWLPGASVTDATAFNGITRNGKSKLAGLTFACGSLDPENAILGALRLLFTTSGTKADMVICNPEDYDSFIAQKDKSKTVQISLGKYELGFDGFNVHSLAGTVPVIPDALCPKGEFYAGPFKNREIAPKLVYVGQLIQIDDKDGQMFVRSASSTAYEMRMYFRGNIVFPAPGKFIRATGLTIT